jgi:hypothetical protein
VTSCLHINNLHILGAHRQASSESETDQHHHCAPTEGRATRTYVQHYVLISIGLKRSDRLHIMRRGCTITVVRQVLQCDEVERIYRLDAAVYTNTVSPCYTGWQTNRGFHNTKIYLLYYTGPLLNTVPDTKFWRANTKRPLTR